MNDDQLLMDLIDLLIEYTQASRKYIKKVESGEVRNNEIYNELKSAFQNTEKLLEKYGYIILENKEDLN